MSAALWLVLTLMKNEYTGVVARKSINAVTLVLYDVVLQRLLLVFFLICK